MTILLSPSYLAYFTVLFLNEPRRSTTNCESSESATLISASLISLNRSCDKYSTPGFVIQNEGKELIDFGGEHSCATVFTTAHNIVNSINGLIQRGVGLDHFSYLEVQSVISTSNMWDFHESSKELVG